ncbi:S8 family serine peptidase [Tenacibaculum sp. M341]|uniref:S8 family serine peptidase n=1 Tax=Tenacibaculum sp. M341 TaxID=2530339 RepID=UPI0014055893|nr:S8 family serine peptidase [Tenacibaculum sp. M341]
MKFAIASAISACLLMVACNKPDEEVDLLPTNEIEENSTKVLLNDPLTEYIPNQYIIVLEDGTLNKPAARGSKIAYEKTVTSLKKEVISDFKNVSLKENNVKKAFGYALQGFVANLTQEQVKELSNDPRVKAIEKDYIISISSALDIDLEQSSSQRTPWGINRVGGARAASNRTAWVLDSGIDLNHPDLNVNVSRSRTFVTSGADSRDADDRNGHGTHVAGTIGALNNNFGVVGVAPGAKLVALKVLAGNGSGEFSWTIEALDYVASNGKKWDVVNMSLGPRTRYTSVAVDNAVRNVASKDIRVVMAAGNSNDDSRFYSPARVNAKRVFTISNMNRNNDIAPTSNYGSPVDFAAPGTNILSTWPGGRYATISGTSMAAPHVAGLLLSGGVKSGGRVRNDKDNNKDKIAVRK